MPLPGVTPFPPEFAARYRARGYWDDQPLIAPFLKVFADYASRAAVIDDEGSYAYAELAAASERVALNLLDLGLEPTDRWSSSCRTRGCSRPSTSRCSGSA